MEEVICTNGHVLNVAEEKCPRCGGSKQAPIEDPTPEEETTEENIEHEVTEQDLENNPELKEFQEKLYIDINNYFITNIIKSRNVRHGKILLYYVIVIERGFI